MKNSVMEAYFKHDLRDLPSVITFTFQGDWRRVDRSQPNSKCVHTCVLNKEVSYHAEAKTRRSL